MRVQLDTDNLAGVKTLEELTKLLTDIFNRLRQDLQNEPNFLVVTSEEQNVPKSLPANTIVFKFDETDIVKTGYYDGENIQLPP